ncbi:MAG: glycogen/starch/alpha-glucan phosphorylase [Pseudomonadota bacterium]
MMAKTDAATANRAGDKSRTGLSIEDLRQGFLDHLYYTQGRPIGLATAGDVYMALAYMVRDRLQERWIRSVETFLKGSKRIVCYLSAEFLVGPQLANNLLNLGIYDDVKSACESAGLDWEQILDQEPEPGLGNGGLGRLAACFLDSLSTLQIPAIGYGIRYEFGIFHQVIRDGRQEELTDKWLFMGNPWEIPHPDVSFEVKFGGRTEHRHDENGGYKVHWVPDHAVRGVAHNMPIPGFRVNTCNTLRLWKAEASESFDFQAFNRGDYYGAVEDKVTSETVSKVLYPNDEPLEGKKLRLSQQYFFVSCSLRDMLNIHLRLGRQAADFHETFAAQLNDTHPALAVAELMRLLVDEHDLSWDRAWFVTVNTFGYTNHTLLPEALEKWPLPLFASLLPRHLEIIYEINRRFMAEVQEKYPHDPDRVARLSLIDEFGEKYVRMANLACVGSHAVNGVAELHTELLKRDVLRDFYELYPERFGNKTNGVTPRRFLALINPGLAELITGWIGDGWITQMEKLKQLENYADDPEFRSAWRKVKLDNKIKLAERILARTGVAVNPQSLFDVQVKRMHEYKRQYLNVLHIITLYDRIKSDPTVEITPRTFIFGGKAAPGYFTAKLIIRLINAVGEVINNDPDVKGRLKVVFYPNFNVKHAQWIYPAADLSEQISTAGKEASGTGNMKFSMNGALTIGTLDGANVEIREEVGPDNFFLFGLTAEEVFDLKAGGYRARDYYEGNERLKHVIDLIASGHFSSGDPEPFKPLVDSLVHRDDYLLLADYQSYVDCQDRVGLTYRDQDAWTCMSILNVARMGKFSSDRTIRQYCDEIWKVKPVPVSLEGGDAGRT